MKKILFILILLSLTVKVFAEGDTPAIRNSRTNIFYIDFDVASNNANSGDTFELGNINDSGIFNSNNDDNTIKQWLNLSEPTFKTYKIFEPNEQFTVNDEWEYNNILKGIKLIYQWYFKAGRWNKPDLDKIVKYGVKK